MPGESDIGGRDARARRLFDRVIAAPESERHALLQAARHDQPSTCAEVEALLAYHDRTSALLDRPVAEAASALIPEIKPLPAHRPTAIGRYRLIREIGRGGMGVVYEAEQEFPRRRIALKVVRPELITPSLVRRFTHEAEALAALQHPGIAQLFEAGFTDGDGARQPYIAMELVPGRSITAHFAEHPAPIAERLTLFARVCDAVEHAHLRGVIHRDLKPANILVAGDQPKVLDFGVARLTGGDSPDHSMTSIGQIIGTLGYMSPEQVAGDPRAIDSRSDIYALGAILYELLAGRPPIDIAGLNLTQAALSLRDRDPVPLGRLDPRCKGDPETIAAKALEKDPARRYQSAADLAADVRRFLAGEPIAARRDSSLYILRKQIRRYRWAVGAGAALAIGIAAVAVWASISAASFRLLAARENTAKTEAITARSALAIELRTSNLERARLLVEGGAAPDGEALIWSEHVRDPLDEDSLWALRDTYGRYPCRAALTGHEGKTEAIAFSPDGSILMSGDRQGGLRVWDPRTGECLKTLQGLPQFVRSIAVLGDNRTAFVSTSDGSLTCWDLVGGCPVQSVAAHTPSRFWLAASPDGSVLATAGPWGDRTRVVRLWEAATLEPIGDLGDQSVPLAHVAFSADGGRLVASGVDGFRVWNLTTRSLLGHAPAGNLLSAAFSPDGTRIAASAIGGAVTLWDAATLARVGSIPRESTWDVRSVSFSRRGDRVLFADTWNIFTCEARDGATAERIAPCSSIIAQLAFSADGATMASTAGDRAVRVWDLSADGPRTWLEPPQESQAYLHMAAVTADGGTIGVVNSSGAVHFWRAADLVHTGSVQGAQVRAFDLAFTPDGSRVASAGADGRVRVWDTAARLPVADFRAHDCLANIRFSPDGATLATAGIDSDVGIWSTADWSCRARVKTGSGDARMVRFTPDGSLLLANNRNGVLLFINPADGAVLDMMRDETAYWGLDISPDGARFALADGTRAIRVFDLTVPAQAAPPQPDPVDAEATTLPPSVRIPIHELRGHREIVWSLAYSPDGALLASASGDGMVKLWDARRGRCLLTLNADDQGFLFPLQFVPGAADAGQDASVHRLITAHGYRGAAIWDLRYFDRFIAGNAEFHLRRLDPAPHQVAVTRRWLTTIGRSSDPPITLGFSTGALP